MKSEAHNDWKKYIIVFFITAAIFGGVMWLSNHLNTQRIHEVKSIQDAISVDILSSETKFALLQELSCEDVANSLLSQELNSLAEKMEYTEKNLGDDNDEVKNLKNYYTLLQIKDFLLAKKAGKDCGLASASILYFYSNTTCDDCARQGYVLTELREKYPKLRVYSFDYDLDNSALQALISVYKIPGGDLPALVVNGKVITGFQKVEDIESKLPASVKALPVPEKPAAKNTSASVKK